MRATRNRGRNTDNAISRGVLGRSDRIQVDSGYVTSERVSRLCGDHLEHAYEALRLTTHGIACISCCYHQDMPDTIICSTNTNSTAIYDTATAKCMNNLGRGTRRCSNAFTPSLSHVAVYGDPQPTATAIELQLCNSNKYTFLEGHTGQVRCCYLSADGSFVISGGRQGQAFLWAVSQPAGPAADPIIKRYTLPGHSSTCIIKACCMSADAHWAATGGSDGSVVLWNMSGLQPAAAAAAAAAESQPVSVSAPGSSGDSSSSSSEGMVQLAAVFQLPKGDQVTCLALSQDGSWLAVGTKLGKVHVAGPGRQQLQQLPARHQEGCKVRCCAVSPDASKLVSVAEDARMVLWDLVSSSCVLAVHEHFKPIRGCCWSPDGKHIATVGMDCLLCVLDLVLLTSHHRLRIPKRLDAGAATVAAVSNSSSGREPAVSQAAAAGLEAAAAAAAAPSSPKASNVPKHPLLQRTTVTASGNRLLACSIVLQPSRSSRQLERAIAAAAATGQQRPEAVLCADQAGKISILLPGSSTAVPTGMGVGCNFNHYCFNGSTVAAARRDGAVTVLSCSAAVPQADSDSGEQVDAQWDPPVAVSAKMDMHVNDVSVMSQLGRVALVGTEKKQPQTGVLWLWEYDPSVRPAVVNDDDSCRSSRRDLGMHSGYDTLDQLVSARSMLSSAESRIPSVASPRGISDLATLDSDGKGSRTDSQSDAAAAATAATAAAQGMQRAGAGGTTVAAAVVAADGWLWRVENPCKISGGSDVPFTCCAWARGECARLVVGSAAGWLQVVYMEGEDMADCLSPRFNIHACEVSAVDFAADGATVVSGSTDGRVIMWSHVTGFKLSAWNLHSTSIRSLAFNVDATLVAVGDAAGIVSSWNVRQGSLITAVQAHDGAASCVGWSHSSSGSPSSSSSSGRVVSCGADGAVSILQLDASIYTVYCAAFRGLYHSCKKSNKIHKLEMAINWHLQQGVLQDTSVLQLLVMLAAADGNVAVLSLLLPMFERMGWLLHFGPVFPKSSGPNKCESDKSLLGRRSIYLQRHYQGSTAAAADDPYAIHPHDREAKEADLRASVLPASRRGTKDSMKRPGHVRNSSHGSGDGVLEAAGRNSRWAHSVADIRTMLHAFNPPPPKPRQLQQQQQQHAGNGVIAAGVSPAGTIAMAADGRSSAQQHSSLAAALLAGMDSNSSNNPNAALGVIIGADVSGGSGGPCSPAACDSPGSGLNSPAITPSLTPTRLLSPAVSRNARAPAALPSLDTLHEVSHAGSEDKQLLARTCLAAAAPADGSAGGAGSSRPSTPVIGTMVGPDDDCSDSMSTNSAPAGCLAATSSEGGSLQRQTSGGTPRFSRQLSPLQQRSSSPFAAPEDVSFAVPHSGSPLQRQGSGSLCQQDQQQQQQQQHRSSMGRQLMSFLSGKRHAFAAESGEQAGTDADTSEGSLPALNMRQRSLSEGASLAQRVSAFRATGLLLGSNNSHQSPGSSPRSPHKAEIAAAGSSSGNANTFAAAADIAAAAAAADAAWDGNFAAAAAANPGTPIVGESAQQQQGTLSSQSSRRRSMRDYLFGSSRRSQVSSRCSVEAVVQSEGSRTHDLLKTQSGFSVASLKAEGELGSIKRSVLPWTSWRERSKAGAAVQVQQQQSMQQQKPAEQQQQAGTRSKDQRGKDDLLQMAMASQQAQCVRLVVDALLEGRFTKVSVVMHLYDSLQCLIHDQQHKRACRRLLKHLPMIDNGEVEVDSLLTHNTKILYKCSAHGHPGSLWASATAGQQPLLDALDVLIKRASWRDSIVALLMWPVLWALRNVGAWWLQFWATQRIRNRVQVLARSQLVPVARAAEIRSGSRGNLLRQLVSANVDADLYGKELVRAIINVKWESFARAFLLMQGVQFAAFVTLFLAYMAVAVYGNDPSWTTQQMLSHPQGRAAVALECVLMIMMFGQAADEVKQILTYGRDYFNSPWNYMDLASCIIMTMLFILHLGRLNHQLFVVLVALEVLLLCLRSLYFCMAIDQIGALLRMVLIVIRDMRYFFMMLVFLLISFGLTFSVLMSPASTSRLNIVSPVGSSGMVENADVQVFGSLEDSITQLFTIMFGDVQFSTLKTIMNINTVASRLAVILSCVYAVLVLIVLVNLLIAIVDETYGVVKESEADQMLRNKALIIDEIESTLTDAVITDLNSRVLLPYVHILVPQAARPDQHNQRRDLHAKFRKLKQFIKQHLPNHAYTAAGADAAAAVGSTGQYGLPAMPVTGSGQRAHSGNPLHARSSLVGQQQQQQQQQQLSGHGGRMDAAAAGAVAATAKLQQDISELSSSLSSINQQLDAVSTSSTAAVAELSAKVEGLQGDIGQVKELLLALLAKQQ